MSVLKLGGKEYTLRIDNRAIRNVKESTGIDLYSAADNTLEFIDLCFERNHRLIPVLRVIASPKPDVSADEWADLFDGDALETGTDAFLGAWADFFRRHPISQQIRAVGVAKATAPLRAKMLQGYAGLAALDG